MADQRRRTTSRQTLARHPRFTEVSPQVGELDQVAFDELLAEDPDEALELLADLTGATDAALRALARRLAGRVAVRLGRGGAARERGVGKLRRARFEPGTDLDVEASLDALLDAAAAGAAPAVDDLTGRAWARPRTALSLVVDRSGSMGGDRLAAAALAAAVVALRAPDDYSVVAFAEEVLVLKAQDADRPTEAVVDDVLALRGHGTTDLALALRTARSQLARSLAPRRAVVLLSDGRPTAGADPVPEARRAEGLFVVAPAGDAADARALAAAGGGQVVELAGPSGIPAALAALVPR